jgi:hypothetical protein
LSRSGLTGRFASVSGRFWTTPSSSSETDLYLRVGLVGPLTSRPTLHQRLERGLRRPVEGSGDPDPNRSQSQSPAAEEGPHHFAGGPCLATRNTEELRGGREGFPGHTTRGNLDPEVARRLTPASPSLRPNQSGEPAWTRSASARCDSEVESPFPRRFQRNAVRRALPEVQLHGACRGRSGWR